jgi:hypothetical protein
VKLGGTLNERLLLGGEINVWTKDQKPATLTLGNASATVTLYPQPSSGFFLRGGAGLSFINFDMVQGSTTVTVDLGTGFGLLAGAGYDVRVGKNVSITPAVDFWYGKHGATAPLAGGAAFGSWNHNVVDVTIGVTFH